MTLSYRLWGIIWIVLMSPFSWQGQKLWGLAFIIDRRVVDSNHRAQNTFKNTSLVKHMFFTMIVKKTTEYNWVRDQTCWFAPWTVTPLHRRTSVTIPTPLAPLAAALKASHPKLPDKTETISVTWRLAEAEPQEPAAEIHSDQKTLSAFMADNLTRCHIKSFIKLFLTSWCFPCVQSKPSLLVQLPRISGVASNWKAVTARHPKINRIQ